MSAAPVVAALLEAGFEDFKMMIPHAGEADYDLEVMMLEEGFWEAGIYFGVGKDRRCLMYANADTAAEALWLATEPKGSPEPFTGDIAAIPGRIISKAREMWAAAALAEFEKSAAEARRMSETYAAAVALLDEAVTASRPNLQLVATR